ncbi:urease accessory protein UreD [Insolitispirillum peregrinum]|uniref:urease accessory protein UreD n=1 Tax=Insolitispirillum peregrinum TaxID=80876 RepID=UPI0036231E93
MFDAILPSENRPVSPPPLPRMTGRAGLAFADGRLAHLYQQAPLRVLFPTPATGEPVQAALVTTSGGLTGGDRLTLTASVRDGSRATVIASAAEKLYRSTGDDVDIDVALSVADGGWLEFLPQETILFDGARLRRLTRIDASGSAQVLAGEMLVFGRTARGERFTRGLARDEWRVQRDGRLVWADTLHVDDPAVLSASAGFAGAVACATALLLTPEPMAWRDAVRELLASHGGRAGATVVNGLLLVRWLDSDAQRLRASFGQVWSLLRHGTGGGAARMPRLWDI